MMPWEPPLIHPVGDCNQPAQLINTEPAGPNPAPAPPAPEPELPAIPICP